ncbi:extracellular matrix protein 2 [Nelusetta ayraudi]|uniref:extracellular matrix protein 2 n=1 Tax=Nelusetta ayraudi TaxID=303726 RepID=UPI003F6EF6D8
MSDLPAIHDPEASLLDVSENDITVIAAQGLAGLLNLESLNMSKNRLDDESFGPDRLPSLTLLKMLDLDSNHISKIPALPPSLEVLKLNHNKLNSLPLDSFKGLQKLVSLELQGNGLYEASLSPQTFRPLGRLVDLHLGGNLFRFVPKDLPASLQKLEMGQNQLEQVTQERLGHCVKLRVLDLSHNRLHEQSVSQALWTQLSSLETLDLSHNQFTQVPPNLPRRLRKLSLQHNNIHHIPAFSFRHLRPGLQSLQLSNNDLSHSSLNRNAFAGTFVSLAELLLDNNRLSEVPQCIRLFKKLQVLRLDNNHIRTVKQWAVCHPKNSDSTLTSLHLESNLLQVEAIPPKTFSCLTDTQGLVLHPQQV